MKVTRTAWLNGPQLGALRLQASRTSRSTGYRVAMGVMWVLVAVAAFRLVRSEWQPEIWAWSLRGLAWVAAFAALALTRPAAKRDLAFSDLALLRGMAPEALQWASMLVHWWPLARLYGSGAVVVSLLLLWRSDEVQAGLQVSIAILLALVVAAGYTFALAGLSRLCEGLAPRHPKALLLALLVLPALLRSGLPAMPSLVHLHHHWIDSSARSMHR